MGTLAGRVSRALAEFRHPGLDRILQWDLRYGNEVVTELITHVPLDSLDEAVCADAAAADAAGADGAGHLRIDLTDRCAVLGLQDRAGAAVSALDLELARRLSTALGAVGLPTTPGDGTAGSPLGHRSSQMDVGG